MATDFIGYEVLIDEFVRRENLLSVPGDFVEIGTLMGGGTIKLAKYLKAAGSSKTLWTVDAFDPSLDSSVNTEGRSMQGIYRAWVPSDGAWLSSVRASFDPFKNIRLLVGDSKTVDLPPTEVSFAIIDGNHGRDHVISDFERCWKRLSPGGWLAFHDFGGDLPVVTRSVEECIGKHRGEVESVKVLHDHKLIGIKRARQPSSGALSPRTAILFWHRQPDDVTRHHLDLLRAGNRCDPDVEIIACGLPGAELLEDSLVLTPDPQLPRNSRREAGSRDDEVDLLLYQFAVSGRSHAYDRIALIGWNCSMDWPVRDLFPAGMSAQCGGVGVRLGKAACRGLRAWNDLDPLRKRLIGGHAGAFATTNGFFASSGALQRIAEGVLRSPRLFDDIPAEIRLCVACRIFSGDPACLRWNVGTCPSADDLRGLA